MASNLTPIQQLSRVLACAAGILVFCLPLYGQAAGPTIAEQPAALTPLQDKAAVEFIAEDLIDSETYVPTLFTADGKPEPLPARTRYYFAGDPVDGAAGTIIQDGDDYANTLLLADGTYRVYAADTFVHDPALDQWREIKSAETDPATFEAVMQTQVDPSLKDLLSGVFARPVYADSVYATGDGMLYKTGAFATIRTAETADGGPSNTGSFEYATFTESSNLYRSLFNFNLTSLSGEVTGAVFHLDCGGDASEVIVPGTFGSSVGTDDWHHFTNTAIATGDCNNPHNYVNFTLNSTGLTHLTDALGGYGGLMMIGIKDYEGGTPGGETGYAVFSNGSNKPYLELTIEAGGPPPDPEATSTPPSYASSTPGLTLETSIYMLFFTIVFCLSLLLGASVLADWFS